MSKDIPAHIQLDDGTTWCCPWSPRVLDAQWRLVHAPDSLTDSDRVLLSGAVNAYIQLVTAGTVANMFGKLRMLRRAWRKR